MKETISGPLITRLLCKDCLDPTNIKRGKAIKAARMEKNITMRQLASMLRLLPSELSKMEHGLIAVPEEAYCSAIMRLDRIDDICKKEQQ